MAAILIPAFLTWAKDLNPMAWRVHRLDEQSRIVSFWDNWINVVSSIQQHENQTTETEELLSSLLLDARTELAEAGKSVLHIYHENEYRDHHEFKQSFEEFQQYRASLSWLRRAFLLYKSPNRNAKNAKLVFYWIIFSPFVIAPIELPLLEHFEFGQRSLVVELDRRISSSYVVRLFFFLAFCFFAIVCWTFFSIRYRNRVIQLENDPTLYLTRSHNNE